MPSPQLLLEVRSDQSVLTLKGSWAGDSLGAAETLLQEVSLPTKKITLILKDAQLDSNGARLLLSYFQEYPCDIQAPLPVLDLLKTMKAFQSVTIEATPFLPWQRMMTEELGRYALHLTTLGKSLLMFFGEIVTILVGSLKNLRIKAISHHLEDFGLRALPIIGLISFLIGMVLAYQGVNQLSRFGAEIFTVDFLGIGVLREIGVLITSIVVAGRSGSAMAAQIGTMKLNQEIDALEVMNLNPVRVLVIPRLIAMLIALPLLVFFSDIMGLVGGMVTMGTVVDLSAVEFWSQLQKAITPTHFWVGMSKAPLFAIIVVIVGCFRGFKVTGSAASVGAMTTRAVVESIFLVIVCDAFMSIFYSYLRI